MTATDGHTGGRLDGRRALITGASSGVGVATARLFAREGAKVALLARRRHLLERLAAELGDDAVVVPADVADPQQVKEAVQTAVERLGGIDIAVNCAGQVMPLSLADLDAQAWHEAISVNLSGSYYVAREVALHMQANDVAGCIVNIGSELSLLGLPHYAGYCSAKAGVIGLTRALAAELAPRIRVNVVCPGPIDSPMLYAEFDMFPDPKAAYDETIERVPLKRLASPDEVAVAIRYLVVDAPNATGSVLVIDGGITVS